MNGHPAHKRSHHLAVGRAIWGDKTELQEEDEKKVQELIVKEVKKKYTPALWRDMTKKDKLALSLQGRVYGRAIATLFGLNGDPSHKQSLHLAVGRAIWGDKTALQEEDEKKVQELIVKEVKESYTSSLWRDMTQKDRSTLTLQGRPYGRAIAKLFGVIGDPVGYRSLHFAIGRVIWGDVSELKEIDKNEQTLDATREIRENFSAESWGNMKTTDKRSLKIQGRPYGIAIANLFGVSGDPIGNRTLHREVGRKIWGDVDSLKEPDAERKKNDIVSEIKKLFNPRQWEKMTQLERKNLHISNQPYGKTIANLFGVSGDPTRLKARHCAIGRVIWGDVEELKEVDIDKQKTIVEKEIREHFTPSMWSTMKGIDRDALLIGNRKYGWAIATLFGLSGTPVNNHKIHLAIGRAIWGDIPELQE